MSQSPANPASVPIGAVGFAAVAITAAPAEFKGGFITVKLSTLSSPPYRTHIASTKLVDIEAAVNAARAALIAARTPACIYVRILRGFRKPNHFDKWQAAQRRSFEVRPEDIEGVQA